MNGNSLQNRHYIAVLILALLSCLGSGCTSVSPSGYDQIRNQLPAIPPGHGRLFICFVNAKVTHHEVFVDDLSIGYGENLIGRFVYLDLPEGKHEITHTKWYQASGIILRVPAAIPEPLGTATFDIRAGQRVVIEERPKSVDFNGLTGFVTFAWTPLFVAPEQEEEVLNSYASGGAVAYQIKK
jgi:hypothetical protein